MRLILLCTLLLGAGVAQAEMVAVSADLAEIRNSPSPSDSVVTILAPRYYPLYIHEERGDLYMVSDYLNNGGWIRKADTAKLRTVIVNAKNANAHQGPGTSHPIVFAAQEGVAFKVIREEGNWLQVEHENGMIGWLSGDLVWGE